MDSAFGPLNITPQSLAEEAGKFQRKLDNAYAPITDSARQISIDMDAIKNELRSHSPTGCSTNSETNGLSTISCGKNGGG